MNLQQLRYVPRDGQARSQSHGSREEALTSQPGVSKQIRELENELGVEIFVRHGKRFVAVTEPGKAVVEVIERLLQEAENLKQVGSEFKDQAAGTLTIATTHTQARYSLPKVVGAFKRRYPKVHLTIKQGNPPQLAEMVLAREADMAIATEALDNYPKLLALPGYEWRHCVVVPAKHPLAKEQRLTLEMLAQYPVVTYDPAFAGRSRIDEAFRAQGLAPNIVLSRGRLGCHQDLRGARSGDRHHRCDGLRREARSAPARTGGRAPVRHHDDPSGGAPRSSAARLCLHIHRVVLAAAFAKADRDGAGRQGRNVRAVICLAGRSVTGRRNAERSDRRQRVERFGEQAGVAAIG